MIDFLFLMLALFATLAVSRAALFDTEIKLAELVPEAKGKQIQSKAETHPIHLSVTTEGKYKWLTEFQEYPMETPLAVQDELARQYQLGILPKDRTQTEVLLHIDKKAPWEPVAELLFAVRQVGFEARPVYEPAEAQKK